MPKRHKLDLIHFHLRLERGEYEALVELFPNRPVAILIRRLIHNVIKRAEGRIEISVSPPDVSSEDLDDILSSDEVPRHSMTGNPKAGDP